MASASVLAFSFELIEKGPEVTPALCNDVKVV